MSRKSPPKFEWWLFAPPIVVLILLLAIVISGRNVPVFLWLNHHSQFGSDSLWIIATTFGDGLVSLVLVLPFMRRKPRLAWSLIVSWLLVALWIKGIKNVISTQRPLSVLSPNEFYLIGARYRFNSFPSGHSTTAAMFAATLCLFYRQKWLRATIIALALLICLSRIAMGLHWPTDVLVGFLGGWLLGLLGFLLSDKLPFGTHRIVQLIIGLVLIGAAIRMLLVNHTDYPQAFRLLQTISLGCIIFAVADLWLGRQHARKIQTAKDS